MILTDIYLLLSCFERMVKGERLRVRIQTDGPDTLIFQFDWQPEEHGSPVISWIKRIDLIELDGKMDGRTFASLLIEEANREIAKVSPKGQS